MDATRDDDRPELESPILQGLGQAVPQEDPSPALRARVLSTSARAQGTSVQSSRFSMAWLAAAYAMRA